MNEIKVCVDNEHHTVKPQNNTIAAINSRIASNTVTLKNSEDVYSFVKCVAENGCTFTPATFTSGSKKEESFEQMQLMALDFDNTISFDNVCKRAEQYDLPMLAAYETFSSTNKNRFRILFLNDLSLDDKSAVRIYKDALCNIFPESDKCDKDITHMYFGGNKKLMYFDKSIPTINMLQVIHSMGYRFKDRYGDRHYKEHIRRFAKRHNIRLNDKGFFDITMGESALSTNVTENGGNSPNPIIFSTANGENPPYLNYQIHLVGEKGTSTSVPKKNRNIHKLFRSYMLSNLQQECRLYREFINGERELHHGELFGLSTSLINVETGAKVFKDTLMRYPAIYDSEKCKKWVRDLQFNIRSKYSPENCDSFCPYANECDHGANILSTAKPVMEKLSGYSESYSTIEEVQQDLIDNICEAIRSNYGRWHVINAQTAAGKTEAYLVLMNNSDKIFLISVPTNKLKRDVQRRAKEKGLEIKVTPSLDEIRSDIPSEVWEKIESLRSIGKHKEVYKYITELVLKNDTKDIEPLKKYLKKLDEFKNYKGHAITTHRKLLNMDEQELSKYDVIIIDEDIILSSIATNHGEIAISDLKKIENKASKFKEPNCAALAKKIRKLLRLIKNDTLAKINGFEWEYETEDDESKTELDRRINKIEKITDIPSFCLATHFIFKKAAAGSCDEDSVVFIKPYKFKDAKYIMVSATVDKDICEYCFGKKNVKFYECKRAEYKGTLNQFYGKSMSRQCIDNNPGIFDRIRAKSGFTNIITFKKYNMSDMYFGNAIGCDYLKGQNIDVVGTPYQVDFVYKLLPFSLGLDIDGDAEMMPCIVTHNGYRFKFTTYSEEHDILRAFHFWMIESELEQSVGRARLLRCDCTVNLYSNFPIKQAVMQKLDLKIDDTE